MWDKSKKNAWQVFATLFMLLGFIDLQGFIHYVKDYNSNLLISGIHGLGDLLSAIICMCIYLALVIKENKQETQEVREIDRANKTKEYGEKNALYLIKLVASKRWVKFKLESFGLLKKNGLDYYVIQVLDEQEHSLGLFHVNSISGEIFEEDMLSGKLISLRLISNSITNKNS